MLLYAGMYCTLQTPDRKGHEGGEDEANKPEISAAAATLAGPQAEKLREERRDVADPCQGQDDSRATPTTSRQSM